MLEHAQHSIGARFSCRVAILEVTVLKFSKLSLEIDGENLLYFDVNLSLLSAKKDYSPYVTYQ